MFLYKYVKNSYRRKVLFIYSLFIIIISVLPVNSPKELENLDADKIVHLLIYSVFVLLYAVSFFRRSHLYIKSFVYGFCLGLFIEILQYFIPYRSFDVLDIAANSLGAVVGLFIVYRLKKAGKFE